MATLEFTVRVAEDTILQSSGSISTTATSEFGTISDGSGAWV